MTQRPGENAGPLGFSMPAIEIAPVEPWAERPPAWTGSRRRRPTADGTPAREEKSVGKTMTRIPQRFQGSARLPSGRKTNREAEIAGCAY